MDNRFKQMVMENKRRPDFGNLLKVLRREVPDRPTLFEFILNDKLIAKLAGEALPAGGDGGDRDWLAHGKVAMRAFARAGYDYYPAGAYYIGMTFPRGEQERASSYSLNEGVMITDRESFEAYPWPDPDAMDYTILDRLGEAAPEGTKLISWGPSGVLENVVGLVGYENLCFMLLDEAALASDVFDAVGSRLDRYYRRCLEHEAVGAIIVNDDWGFKTQTMLSPADMRKYVVPWHARIVAAAHEAGRPAIMHSCGRLEEVMDDVIDVIGMDAKHSYEDTIEPVEQVYDRLGGRIAILGGIDMDFLCRSTPQQVHERAQAMLQRAAGRGGYALGTGNSVPEYVPQENYFAMLAAALG